MFDIGFPELVLVAIVGLLVIGPERLPEALRTLGLWLGRMRRSFVAVKTEIEKEIGMDEVRRQLHNEAIMEEMKRIEQQVKGTMDDAQATLNEGAIAAQTDPGDSGKPAPTSDPATQTATAGTTPVDQETPQDAESASAKTPASAPATPSSANMNANNG